jgi:peptidoglycan/xylan/chitin deacetylase (PgdA/CDA1 family)
MPNENHLPWPGGCQGAVSLSFDDGHQTHLEKVVPILAEFGLLGTFYVNPRGDECR